METGGRPLTGTPQPSELRAYWLEYYGAKRAPKEPSEFAKWFLFKTPEKALVVDAGAGNLRDSVYLAKHHDIMPVDWVLGNDVAHFDYSPYDWVYCRWLLHAMPERDATRFLYMATHCKKGIAIECRSDRDDVPPKDEHYRRPCNLEKLEKYMSVRGFDIMHSEESRGLSPMGEDDPLLIRMLATRRQ